MKRFIATLIILGIMSSMWGVFVIDRTRTIGVDTLLARRESTYHTLFKKRGDVSVLYRLTPKPKIRRMEWTNKKKGKRTESEVPCPALLMVYSLETHALLSVAKT
ncbi:MAG: hypothetical protein PHT37_07650 [Candidatus Cloacimonetes bacterium]|jgi:hypothetical protein|nr:hypothetical protein [Candidatus Cloacimonadota bacterium]MDD4277744.1 hypothetical protein [Candidatus Cloacimonadota bacterium]